MPFVSCADGLLQGFQLFMDKVVMVLRTAWYRKLDTRIAGKSMSMVCVHVYMCVLLLRSCRDPFPLPTLAPHVEPGYACCLVSATEDCGFISEWIADCQD